MNRLPIRLCSTAMVLGLLVLGACGNDDDDSVSGASADVCTQITALTSDMKAAPPITKDTTVDEVKKQKETYQTDVDNIIEARGDLAEARFDALKSAMETFADEVDNNVSGSDTVGEAATQVKAAQVTLNAALVQIAAESKCTITPGSAPTT